MPENQILAVDEAKVFCPPDKLHVPEAPSTNSDSAFSLQEDSDMSSSESSSAASSPEPHDVQTKDSEVIRLGVNNWNEAYSSVVIGVIKEK